MLGTKEFVEEKGIELEGNTGAVLGPDLGNLGSYSKVVSAENLLRMIANSLLNSPLMADKSSNFVSMEFTFSHNRFKVFFVPS